MIILLEAKRPKGHLYHSTETVYVYPICVCCGLLAVLNERMMT